MRTGYKIIEQKDCFSVWELKNFGEGYAWEDTKLRFQTRNEALDHIARQQRGPNKEDGQPD